MLRISLYIILFLFIYNIQAQENAQSGDVSQQSWETSVSSTPINNTNDIIDGLHNFPNPFSTETIIAFRLNNSGIVSITVFDFLGNKVSDVLTGEYLTAGYYHMKIAGNNFPGGTYFYEVKADQVVKTGKMIVKHY